MKSAPILAALLALSCEPALAQPGDVVPRQPAAIAPTVEQTSIMDRIERDVRLPEDAGPLGSYVRYYALHQDSHGTRIVTGIYVRSRTPGRRWVEETELPMIDDGGCGVVSVNYDLAAQRIQNVYCNGLA